MKAARTSHIRLAAQDGHRVGRTSKTKRIEAGPAGQVARLYSHLARVRREAEEALAAAERAEALLQKAFGVACSNDKDLTIAMMRHVLVEARMAGYFHSLIRTIEMAEEGTLCA